MNQQILPQETKIEFMEDRYMHYLNNVFES